MSAEPRTLSKRVATLRLSEHDDIERLFPPEFARIVIWADTVQVEGWIRLHGRDLQIHARCIDARPVAGRPAVLDVSGRPAQPDFDPEAPSSRPKGTANAPDGQPGEAGGAGQDGGRVSIVVDRVQGSLGLAANGSRGGHSECGSDGAQPAAANGVDGAFLPGKWPTKSKFGGGVLQKPGLQKYVSWAAGQPGGNARVGGAAGAPGRPGDGGRGGVVRLVYSGLEAPSLATIANGGAAGGPGLPAKPGPAGAPGTGGRNLIYAYDIFGTNKAFARAGKDKVVDGFARQYKIPARAATGKTGAGAGAVPPQPIASPGEAGSVQVEPVPIDAVGKNFDLPFLRLVLAYADSDRASGEGGRAMERYRWLARLAEPLAKQAPAAADIWRAADEATRTFGDEPAAAPAQRSRRCR